MGKKNLTWAFERLVLNRLDQRHCVFVREDHEVADLLQDDLPDDVGEAGGVEGVGDAAEVEVDLRARKEVSLGKGNLLVTRSDVIAKCSA